MKGNTLFTYVQLGSGTPEYEVLQRQNLGLPQKRACSQRQSILALILSSAG